MLEVGTKAPGFTLPDKDGNPVSLSDFLGKRSCCIFTPRTIRPAVRGRPAPLPQRTRILKPWTLW